MKKCWFVISLMLLLTGCGAVDTFETVGDDLVLPVAGKQRQIVLVLPESATAPVMNDGDGSRLYLCDRYVLTVQTLDGGDLNRTVRTLSGYCAEQLTVMETTLSEEKRYDWVWSAAGEGGDSIGRAAVLDDGDCHYCVTVMADAQVAGALEEEWSRLFSGFTLG